MNIHSWKGFIALTVLIAVVAGAVGGAIPLVTAKVLYTPESVAEVVEVEVPVRTVHVGVRHVDVAVGVRPPRYTKYLL